MPAITSGLTFSITRQFFDRKAVIAMLDKKRSKALGKQGAFLRNAAIFSIKKKSRPKRPSQDAAKRQRALEKFQAPSPPGSPPFSRGPKPNLRSIYYAYDGGSDSVVVGPVRLNTKINAAAVHEHGQAVMIRRRGKPPRLARYPKRPFMGPALTRSLVDPRFMAPWKD